MWLDVWARRAEERALVLSEKGLAVLEAVCTAKSPAALSVMVD